MATSFRMIVLTLHKTVLYASNHGYVHPNEIDYEPCRLAGFLLSMENPQLGWGFRKAFSFKPVIKTPFDLLKHLAVWQLQKFNKKSKGGPNGGRKELSAHPMEL
ncbi:hypothetical protein CF455_23605 [Salmonella enterica]|nr:hypothetical protein [Salmonella enterica]